MTEPSATDHDRDCTVARGFENGSPRTRSIPTQVWRSLGDLVSDPRGDEAMVSVREDGSYVKNWSLPHPAYS